MYSTLARNHNILASREKNANIMEMRPFGHCRNSRQQYSWSIPIHHLTLLRKKDPPHFRNPSPSRLTFLLNSVSGNWNKKQKQNTKRSSAQLSSSTYWRSSGKDSTLDGLRLVHKKSSSGLVSSYWNGHSKLSGSRSCHPSNPRSAKVPHNLAPLILMMITMPNSYRNYSSMHLSNAKRNATTARCDQTDLRLPRPPNPSCGAIHTPTITVPKYLTFVRKNYILLEDWSYPPELLIKSLPKFEEVFSNLRACF